MAFFTPIIKPGMNLWNIDPYGRSRKSSSKAPSRKRASSESFVDAKVKAPKVVSASRAKRSTIELLQRRCSVPQTSSARTKRTPGGCNGLCNVRSCKARLVNSSVMIAGSAESLQSLTSQRYMSLHVIVEEDDDDIDGSLSTVSSDGSLELGKRIVDTNIFGPPTSPTVSSLSRERKHGRFLRRLRKMLGLKGSKDKEPEASTTPTVPSPKLLDDQLVPEAGSPSASDARGGLVGFVRSLSHRRRS
ncbi:hypothetical protein RvY_08988 [Ramazzottius varieornatus]|uniref:Uncharacterized protein n=1 Tax=Ramazzottius varieornatus TaxID=947166 RepID=A0A1D1VDD7_RAMVA|nr:hypothetical protein RvY_08988 [Ramazzottius varieornatus]